MFTLIKLCENSFVNNLKKDIFFKGEKNFFLNLNGKRKNRESRVRKKRIFSILLSIKHGGIERSKFNKQVFKKRF